MEIRLVLLDLPFVKTLEHMRGGHNGETHLGLLYGRQGNLKHMKLHLEACRAADLVWRRQGQRENKK